jgi:Gram-negative bacterial TonB protein C-terminal
MIRAAFDDRVKARVSSERIVPVLTSTNVDQRYLPGRGILWSLLVHSIVIYGLLFISVSADFMEPPRPRVRVTMIDLKDPNYRLYLPVLMGADPPAATQANAGPRVSDIKPGASNPTKGLSYPGPQPIVSDFPNPTNRIQTILQPALEDPPVLPPPLTLPNIVQLPEVVPASALPTPKLVDAFKLPDLQPPTPPIQEAKLKAIELPAEVAPPPIGLKKVVLPVSGPQDIPDIAPPKSAASKTGAVSVPQTPSARNQPDIADAATTKPVEPLLTLSPMPAPAADTAKIPAGEARGRFTISPDPNLTEADKEPGTKTDPALSTPGTRAGTGNGSASAGNSETAAGSGPKKDKDSGNSGAGANSIREGTESRSAASPVNGKSKSGFPGITILNSGAGANAISAKGAEPLQTSYGVMIVSTESSGGGLPQFGVFSNEQVFTVFVDMRRTISDLAPSWTFEYAVLKGIGSQSNVAVLPKGNQQGLVLPFPLVKEQPTFPPELALKYIRRRIIVYAVINMEGKMEQMVVKESPDPLLNQPLLSALTKWSFRPAQVNGENVAVKALVGIPVFLPQ